MTALSLEPPARLQTRPDRVIDPHLVLRSEPCACGAHVAQLAGERVETAVKRHQRTTEHALWRELGGY